MNLNRSWRALGLPFSASIALLLLPSCVSGQDAREESDRVVRAERTQRVARGSESRHLAPSSISEAAKPARAGVAPAEGFSRLIPWGQGETSVGLRPTAPLPESVPEGPSAIAVAEGGEVLVLDRLKGRVLEVTRGGVTQVAAAPRDAEDLAAGPGGVIGLHSPLRSRVFLRQLSGGTDLGELGVPRELRLVRGVVIGATREVLVQDAHQETYRIGRPGSALELPAVLHSKREGEWLLGDGRGLALRRHGDGRAELLVLRRGPHAPVELRRWLPGEVLAARIIGLASGIACLRLERARPDHGPRISVDREALCLEVLDGREIFRRALPDPAASRYLPRRELALGGAPLRLAFMSPREDGLQVELWPLPVSGASLASAPGEVRR